MKKIFDVIHKQEKLVDFRGGVGGSIVVALRYAERSLTPWQQSYFSHCREA
jgi:hypothetical protein